MERAARWLVESWHRHTFVGIALKMKKKSGLSCHGRKVLHRHVPHGSIKVCVHPHGSMSACVNPLGFMSCFDHPHGFMSTRPIYIRPPDLIRQDIHLL
jgi:hypothetical protein